MPQEGSMNTGVFKEENKNNILGNRVVWTKAQEYRKAGYITEGQMCPT